MNMFISIIYPHLQMYFEIIVKVLLAIILGGLIGLERESINRPAGFRTHILVCVGAALVMINSEYIYNIYKGTANLDPARLGAQVISGIGFLGAGTIIKDGVTVKGLTTAATLWTVSCIGLAVGSGFYSGAIITAISVYIVLIFFRRLDVPIINKKRRHISIKLEISRESGTIGDVEKLLYENQIKINGVRYLQQTDDTSIIKIFLTIDNAKQYDEIISAMTDIEGVKRVVQY